MGRARVGLPADALPADLLVEPAAGVRVFPDQPVRGNRFDADILIGRLRQSFAVLLTRSGDIELPPIELTWWDLNTDRARVARLPGRVIRVAASGDPTLDGSRVTGRQFIGEIAGAPPNAWQKAILIVLIVALYLAWTSFGDRLQHLLWAAYRRHQSLQRLRRACIDDNPRAARDALLYWSRQQWPDRPGFGLAHIRRRLPSPELARALTELDAAIYAANKAGWQGRDLWYALQTARQARADNRVTDRAATADLYPEFGEAADR